MATARRPIYALMKADLLKPRMVINPINRCRQVIIIMPNEVAKFRRKYVSLFALAKERSQHFKRVKNELDAQGIEPAFDLRKIGAWFYARAQP